MTQIEHLIEILKTVKQHGSPEAVEWFESSCADYLSDGKRRTLDDCMGLGSTTGIQSPRTKYQKALRNEYLKSAFEFIDENLPPSRRCDVLADEIKAFETRIYPQWMSLEKPPENASQLRKYLFLAKRTGEPLSTHWRSLHLQIFGV